MKKIIISCLVLLSIISVGCSSCKDKNENNIPIEVAKNINIELTKSECFGKCPAFTLVYANGIIKLNAINNMKKQGIFTIKLSDNEIKDFYKYIMETEVLNDSKEESYDQTITDLPYSKMLIRLNEKFKEINYRLKPPKSITKVDELFMKIIDETERYELRED